MASFTECNVIKVLLTVLLLTSCARSIAPLESNVTEFMPANAFIGDLKEGKMVEDWVVQASVTTSDEAGNFYQSLYIQEATGILELRFSFYDSFKLFHLGDVVSVRLQNYVIQKQNNQLYVNIGTLEMASRNVIRQGLHDPIIPQVIEIADIDSTLTGRLVEIRDGKFANGGKESWSGEQKFAKGKNSITIYTSPLASYANELLPFSNVSITGIVTLYNGKFQIKMSRP